MKALKSLTSHDGRKSSMSDADPLPRFRSNLQGEIDGVAVYTALAESETDQKLAEVFGRLAAVEQAHGEFWRKRIEAQGARFTPSPSPRARFLAWLARRFGPAWVLPAVAAGETIGRTSYDSQPEAQGSTLAADERSHALLMQVAAGGAGLAGPVLASLEGRHRSGGNALRAAVLGANDGLVSNMSLVMGVAGAAAAEQTLLLTGLAGLIAGACSMAMGEWLSVTSSRELYQRQISVEAEELRTLPDEEREELILIYQAKGIDEPQARALAEKLLSNQSAALNTLAREELGIDPDKLGGSAWGAAASSFLLFSVGAIVPVVPFMLFFGLGALIASLAASAVALMLIGVGTSLFTGRGMLFSAFRQLAFGLAAAGLTYGAGALLGVSVS